MAYFITIDLIVCSIHTSFDVITYNMHRYFASCIVFFQAPKGQGKIWEWCFFCMLFVLYCMELDKICHKDHRNSIDFYWYQQGLRMTSLKHFIDFLLFEWLLIKLYLLLLQNPPSFTLSDPKPTLLRSTSYEGPLRKLAPTEDFKRQSLMEPLTVPLTTEPLLQTTPQVQ